MALLFLRRRRAQSRRQPAVPRARGANCHAHLAAEEPGPLPVPEAPDAAGEALGFFAGGVCAASGWSVLGRFGGIARAWRRKKCAQERPRRPPSRPRDLLPYSSPACVRGGNAEQVAGNVRVQSH